jgi:hypothetical protein
MRAEIRASDYTGIVVCVDGYYFDFDTLEQAFAFCVLCRSPGR